MLQEAHVAVIDEVYNGNEAALKSLLAPMSEGCTRSRASSTRFPCDPYGHRPTQIPGPEERREKGLTGFHDRWLFRFIARDLESDSHFMKMLWDPGDRLSIVRARPTTVGTEELEHLAEAASRVRLSVAIAEELARCAGMQAEGLFCSPRRWKAIVRAMQAAALLAGRSDVTETISSCCGTLWDDPEDIPRIEKLLEDYVTAVRDRAAIKFSRILEICSEFNEKRKASPHPTDVSKLALDARSRLEARIEEMEQLKRRSNSEADNLVVDQYLQKAYDYLHELDQAAGL